MNEDRGSGIQTYGHPPYGLTRNLGPVDFTQVRAAVLEALSTEGFGALTEIDVQATMKKRLDVEMRPYVIIGACNPQLAHQALSAEAGLGLLLPCNVVLALDPDGSVIVSVANPVALFSIVDNPEVGQVVALVQEKLARALEAVKMPLVSP